jgi:threonine aldolase
MRQSGIVAAAGLYALDHHVDRLAEDHDNARALAEGLAEIGGVSCDPATVETNIVMFDLEDAVTTGDALREAGAQLTRVDGQRMRAVTHLDVDRAGIDQALEIVRTVMASA